MAAWDRQPEESAAAYEAFCAYRDLGSERTALAAYRQQKGKPEARQLPGTWTAWGSAHRWRERAEAYDVYLEAEARKREEREAIRRRADMLKRHRQAAELLTRRGIERLAKHEVDTTRDAIVAIKTGVELERQVEGLPTWAIEIMNADPDTLRSLVADLDGRINARESVGDAAALGAGRPITNGNGKH